MKSKHAKVRCQQRGISQNQVDLIVAHGHKSRRSGGAWEYRLRKKDRNKLISKYKKQIQMVERSVGKGVLVSYDQETVVTAYHLIRR